MNFYFTFGYGTPYRNNFVKIEADTYGQAREEMARLHGRHWAFQYTEKGFAGQEERYGLTELRAPALGSTLT